MATFRPRRLAAFTALWRAVVRGQRPGAPGLGERLSAPSRGWCGRRCPAGTRRWDAGGWRCSPSALAYLISPVDLVPEAVVPLLGLADDGVVALWLAGAFLAETDNYLRWERSRPVMTWLTG